MAFDPFGTVRQALWIGGAQWAGKSTVADLLAHRHGITAYHYDFHDARGHWDRRAADAARRGEPYADFDPESCWVDTTPARMAEDAQRIFRTRFDYTLDDLRALVSPRPILAEGYGLRPELVAPLLDSPRRMVVLVPSAGFVEHQVATLDRARGVSTKVSDPVRAQRNRLDRDRILAADAVESARRHGIRVVTVDGSRDAEAVGDLVADHFADYLPAAAVR
ncbi:MAG: hypothetical protein WCA46_25875 [Actinocatenispora sp.]